MMGNNTRAGGVNPIPICFFQRFSRTLLGVFESCGTESRKDSWKPPNNVARGALSVELPPSSSSASETHLAILARDNSPEFDHPRRLVLTGIIKSGLCPETITMPYWSSSRVGAVPQQPSSTNKNKQRGETFARKKGITMEVSDSFSTLDRSCFLPAKSSFCKRMALGEKTVVILIPIEFSGLSVCHRAIGAETYTY
jgi:hypothetical protein